MQRAVLILLVVAALAVAAIGILYWDSPSATATDLAPHAASDEQPEQGAPPERPAGSAAAELAQPAGSAAERALAPADAVLADEGPRRSATVRVLPPAGCASDASVEVVAFEHEVQLEAALEALFPAAREDRPRNPFGFGEGEAAIVPDAPRVVARATAGADGAFRLELPAERKQWHLIAVGRSWHASVTKAIEPTDEPIELATECGAWVDGTAVLPSGSAPGEVEGVTVVLRTGERDFSGPTEERRFVSRRAAISGARFEFRALPAGTFDVRATPARLAHAEARAEGLEPGRGKVLALEFLRGATVRGRVRAQDGAPVAGAKVEAQRQGNWFGFDDRALREGLSAADGSFELVAVAPGKVEVEATAEGWLADKGVRIEAVDGGANEGVEILMSRGSALAGTLTWADGTPAADLEVRVSFDLAHMAGMGAFNARSGAKGEDKCDELGRFRVDGLGKGPFRVEARALPAGEAASAGDLEREARRRREHRAYAEGVKPDTLDLALVLRPPTGLAGRVVDTQGAPLSEFRVHANGLGAGVLAMMGQEERHERFQDEHGQFLIEGLHDGRWKLRASAEGFAGSDGIELTLPREAAAEPLVITLVREAIVSGSVLGPDGRPIAGATVEVDDGQPNWARAMQGGERPSVKSDEQGHFELAGLKPGTSALVADHERFARSEPVSLALTEGARVADAVLRLREGGRLTGEVFDDGKPAVGFMIQVQDTKRFSQSMSRTNDAGRFELEHLDPGPYQVIAMPARGLDMEGEGGDFDPSSMMSKLKMASTEIRDGEATHVVLGAPPADPVKVTGRVLLTGAPVTSASLTFMAEGGGGLGALKTTGTKADGTYELTLDGPGAYNVSVQRFTPQMDAQSVYERRVEVPKASEHALDIVLPEGRISGRVSGPDGEPLAQARVSIGIEGSQRAGTFWGGQFHELRTGADGTYDAQGLDPGTYAVSAGGADWGGMLGMASQAAGGRETKGGLALGKGEWLRGVDFRLRTPGAVEVTVVDATGAPVSGATVFARDGSGRMLDVFSGFTTDASGVARYGGLAPGRYSFRARTAQAASGESAGVTLEEGGSAAARIALEPGTTIYVKVQGGESQPLPASVEVLDTDGRDVGRAIGLAEIMERFTSGGLGGEEQRFGPFPAGKYRVRATLEDGRVETKPITLSGQPERRITLRFD